MLANSFNITANNVLNVQNINDLPQQQRSDQKQFVELLNNNQTMTKQQYGAILRQQMEYNKQNKNVQKEKAVENKIGQNISYSNNQPNFQQEILSYKNDPYIQEEKYNTPSPKSAKYVRGAFFRIHQDQNQLEEKRKRSEQWSRELQQQIEEKNQRDKRYKQDQNQKDLQYEQQINQDRNILKEKNKEIVKEEQQQNNFQNDLYKYQNLDKINQQAQKNIEIPQSIDQDDNNSFQKFNKNEYTWRPTGQWQPSLIDVNSLKQIQNERQNKLVQEVNNLKLELEIASQNRNNALLDMLMLRNKTRVSNLNDIMNQGDLNMEQPNEYLIYDMQQEPNINYNLEQTQVLDSKSLFVNVDNMDQQNKNDHGQTYSVQSINKSKLLSEFDYREDMIVPEAENEESVKEEDEEEQNNSFQNKNQYNDEEDYQELQNKNNQIQDSDDNENDQMEQNNALRNTIHHTIEEQNTHNTLGFYDGQINNMMGDIDGILKRLESNIKKTKGFSYIPNSYIQQDNAQIEANQYINKYTKKEKQNKHIQNPDASFVESFKNIEIMLKDLQK